MYKKDVYFEVLSAKSKRTLNSTTPTDLDGGKIHVTQEVLTKEAGADELPNLQNAFELDLNKSPRTVITPPPEEKPILG